MPDGLPAPLRPVDPGALREAADWFAVLSDSTATDADRAAWQQWLEASPDHAAAWERVESKRRQLQRFAAPRERDAARHALHVTRLLPSRRHALKAVAAVAAVGVLAWGAVHEAGRSIRASDHRASVAPSRPTQPAVKKMGSGSSPFIVPFGTRSTAWICHAPSPARRSPPRSQPANPFSPLSV